MGIKDVWCHTEGGDERFIGLIHGVWSTQELAVIAARSKGAWGSNGTILPRKVYCDELGNSYLLANDFGPEIDLDREAAKIKEARKQEILSKLSEEDRKILGF